LIKLKNHSVTKFDAEMNLSDNRRFQNSVHVTETHRERQTTQHTRSARTCTLYASRGKKKQTKCLDKLGYQTPLTSAQMTATQVNKQVARTEPH